MSNVGICLYSAVCKADVLFFFDFTAYHNTVHSVPHTFVCRRVHAMYVFSCIFLIFGLFLEKSTSTLFPRCTFASCSTLGPDCYIGRIFANMRRLSGCPMLYWSNLCYCAPSDWVPHVILVEYLLMCAF